jgi:hypothetical protein
MVAPLKRKKRMPIWLTAGIIIAGYLLVIAFVVIWGRTYDNWQLREQLKWASPLILEINFYLLLAALATNLKFLKTLIMSIPRKTLTLVMLIALGGTLLAAFEAPRTHRIFYDEDIYLNIGQNIAYLKRAAMCNEGRNLYGVYQCAQLEYNKEPNAWPYLISVLFRLFPPSHVAVFLMNNVIWGIAILIVFFTGYLLFHSARTGLFSALILAIIPEGLRWANTTAAEPSTACFAGLAILSVLVFSQSPGNRTAFLAAVFIPFAFQFRPESGMIVVPAALLLLFIAPQEFKTKRLYLALLLLTALTIPHLMHLYSMRGEAWGVPAGSSKFGLQYFANNFRTNFFFYWENLHFPLLVTLLFVVGIVSPSLHPRLINTGEHDISTAYSYHWQAKSVVLSWFLLFCGIFLFFYAGSYYYGADMRFSLLSYLPLSILSGFGAATIGTWCEQKIRVSFVTSSLVLLLSLWGLSFMPYVRSTTQEAWEARADHDFAETMAGKVPPHALILTHNPHMFLLWGNNAAQGSIATNHFERLKSLFQQYPGGIYFHYNFWCMVQDPLQKSFCDNILQKFSVTEIIALQEQQKTFRLYKLEMK